MHNTFKKLIINKMETMYTFLLGGLSSLSIISFVYVVVKDCSKDNTQKEEIYNVEESSNEEIYNVDESSSEGINSLDESSSESIDSCNKRSDTYIGKKRKRTSKTAKRKTSYLSQEDSSQVLRSMAICLKSLNENQKMLRKRLDDIETYLLTP